MINKITCISDTHGKHWDIKTEGGDLLILAGDYEILTIEDLRDFRSWLNKQQYRYRVLVMGNHDFLFSKQPVEFLRNQFTNCHILYNDAIIVDGIKIWGSPMSPKFLNWAYMASEFDLSEIYSKIPKDTDIIISHSPPHAILDSLPDGKHVVSYALQGILKKINPKLFVCGHIHGAADDYFNGKTLFVNASVLDEKYQLVNEPYNLDWNILNNKINLTAKH
jgi:Icc-related predicted phosphoesterase